MRTRLRRDFKAEAQGTIEIISRQFRDGTVLELIEDPEIPTRTLLAVRTGVSTIFVEEFKRDGCLLVPVPRDGNIVETIALPDGVAEFGSASQLARSAGDFLVQCIPMAEGAKRILSAFVVCTWVPEFFAHFPCLIMLGPNDVTIPLLRALRLICRHALLVGDATSAGILQACSRWQATLLLFNFGLRSDAFRTLKAGAWADMRTLQKGGLLSGFGPKLIAAPEMPVGLEDCESVLAFSAVFEGTTETSTLGGCEMEQHAKYLRRSLLGLRLEVMEAAAFPSSAGHVKSVAYASPIHCLGVPFAADEEFFQELLEAAIWNGAQGTAMLPVCHRATLSELFFLTHEKRAEIKISEVAGSATKSLECDSEEIRVSPKKVGSILKALGFPKTYRDSSGYFLENSEYVKRLVHQLIKRYALPPLDIHGGRPTGVSCRHCRESGLVPKGILDNYEAVIKPSIEQAEREAAEQQRRELREVEARMRPERERFERDLGIPAEPDSELRLVDEEPSASK